MALINRISRLFRADFNAVLDRLEEPDVLLKQAIREMEESLYQDKQQLKIFTNDQVVIAKRFEEVKKKLEATETQLDICFEADNQVLAKNQVRKKLELLQLLASIKKQQEAVNDKKNTLEEKVSENKSRFLSMKQKLELFISTNEHSRSCEEDIVNSISDHDIEIAYLQEKKMRTAS